MLRQAHTTNIYTKREHYSFYTFYTYNLSQSQVESPAKRIMLPDFKNSSREAVWLRNSPFYGLRTHFLQNSLRPSCSAAALKPAIRTVKASYTSEIKKFTFAKTLTFYNSVSIKSATVTGRGPSQAPTIKPTNLLKSQREVQVRKLRLKKLRKFIKRCRSYGSYVARRIRRKLQALKRKKLFTFRKVRRKLSRLVRKRKFHLRRARLRQKAFF